MDIGGMLRRLKSRVDMMVSRAVINVVNDSLKTQRVQITLLDDEHFDNVELLQPYGMSFTPPAGSEALALAVGGMASHLVAICANEIGQRPSGNPAHTGGLYTRKTWRVFIDDQGMLHLGAQKGDSPVARSDKTDQRLDKLEQKVNDLVTDAKTHFHPYVNATAPATTSPVAASSLTPLGPAESTAAQHARVS